MSTANLVNPAWSHGEVQLIPGTVDVVVLLGDHDVATAPRVRESFTDAVGHRRDVIVDLTDVTFFDASVLGEIVLCRNTLGSSGHRVTVRTGSPAASRLFEVTGLGQLVEPDPIAPAAGGE